MTRTRRTRIPAEIAALAPSVDPAWVEAFVVEQRLSDVPGEHIGDALAVVESHVRESGESALEAFGEPTAYARSLNPTASRRPLGGTFIAAMVLGLIGMLTANSSLAAWLEGERVTLTVGGLVVAGLLGLALTTLLAASGSAMRALVGRPWSAVLLPVVLLGLSVAALLLLPQVLVSLPVGAVAVGAVLALVFSSLLLLLDGGVDDPVRGPGQQAQTTRRAGWLGALHLPGMTVVLLGLTALTHALA